MDVSCRAGGRQVARPGCSFSLPVEAWVHGNWLRRVFAQRLTYTTAVDWERQFQGGSVRELVTMLHDESTGNGIRQRAGGRFSTVTILPCWQRGQMIKDRPVSS